MYFTEDEYFARKLQNEFNLLQGSQYQSPNKQKDNTNPVDSKLELIDPTPSIHELFVRFDKKFFWSSLGMVQVTWSNRMTKCAGMCSFQGKRGLCKISLSAPLLSLRPRKDLVETLLHEMIHAYLFVTDNYRDREDHGPQFHKHMFRINKEAGTNITVYHSFHDEVEYYQRHIWRCNGPCQNKRPYFGFVKRAVNRAPGPNDTWWNQHKIECNGTYIKIAEPEEKPKSRKKIKSTQQGKTKDIRDFFNSSKPTTQTNIKTLADLKITQPVTEAGLRSNCGGTLAITNTKKGARDQTNASTKIKEPIIQNKNTEDVGSEKVREVVRNVWANKFSTSNPTKKKKLQCPKCDEGFLEEDLEVHKKDCQKMTDKKSVMEESSSSKNEEEIKHCPVCNEKIIQSKMNEHLENCLSCTFENDWDSEFEGEGEGENEVLCESVPCPCCYQWFLEKEMNSHIDECLTLNALKEEMLS